MGCKCARRSDQYHGWECTVTDGECAFLAPNSNLCAEINGEGPDADKEAVCIERVSRVEIHAERKGGAWIMKKFQEMKDFIHTFCPLPNHWCNGKPISSQATIKLPPCQYYIPGKGCTHPENPKNRKKRTAQRSKIIEGRVTPLVASPRGAARREGRNEDES